MRFFSEKRRPPAAEEQWSAPRLVLTDSGRVDELESFPQYVGRQLGFDDMSECPQLGKLAHDYLKKAAGCEDNIFAFFANEPSPENLYAQLVEELDRCILGYFAFHWTHATLLIRQVLTVESEQKKKLKNIVMEATRKMRFERVTRDLKVTRVFSTLVEEMKAIGMGPNGDADARCTDKMVPAAPSERSPVLLLMGGGMGAGKSTVLKDILREPFWAGGAGANAVVVEADAFKETDVIYRALSSRGHHHDMLQTAELLIGWKDGSSSLLVDPEEIDVLKKVATLNEDADNVHELYAKRAGDACKHPSVWDDVVHSPSRAALQQELRMAIRRMERFRS